MSGRKRPEGHPPADGAHCPVPALEVDDEMRVQSLTAAGELVFEGTDEPVVGADFASLEAAGILSEGTVARFDDTLSEHHPNTTTTVDFEMGVSRPDPLEPITYRAIVGEADTTDRYRLSLGEKGVSSSSPTVLSKLQGAVTEFGGAETTTEVLQTLRRQVNDLVGPTGLDVRFGESGTDTLDRVSGTDSGVTVDRRQSPSRAAGPYSTVLAESGHLTLDGSGTQQTEDLPTDFTTAVKRFTEIAVVAVGGRGILAVGRLGAGIQQADIAALETLAGSAWESVEKIRHRSREREQRTELEGYETLGESIPDPIYSTDRDGKITVANRAFERAFGYDPQKHPEAHISQFTTTESAATIREEIRTLIEDDQAQYTELAITGVPTDGREREYAASIGVITQDGNFEGAVGVLRDMTDQQRREEISKVLNRALRHNLRSTTNNIKGYAEVTQEQVSDDLSTHMDVIQTECDWLMKLADTLRNVRTSVQQGLETEDVIPISSLVDPIVEEYEKTHPEANLEVHYNTAGRAEGGRTLRSALAQIVENAIEHSDSAEPSVEIWVANAPANGWVDIHVEDDGPGIPQQEIDLVMGETEITQLQHGSGIGLWVSRWLVETFGGELRIESDPGGSVVTLRLQKLPE